ncbi:hypothetical protein MSG28_014220, partial [Choristoneura fumiferana]
MSFLVKQFGRRALLPAISAVKKVNLSTSNWLLTAGATNTRNKRQSVANTFPANFSFGAATASYQIEGAWDVDGKGMSIWDYLVRTEPNHIADNSNGDIAANSYYNYKRDIEMLKELGATHYRFSISWTRILPLGRSNYVNQRGIDHYNAFIDELLANGIVPFATMYHWDLPQTLSELGGWTNEEIVDWFGDYARILYQNFGDRVKHWLTINEPFIHCNFGYGYAEHAPRIFSPGQAYYECGRHILLANARAYHIYNNEFRNTQNGQVGVVLSSEWAYPATSSVDDIQAAEDSIAFHLGIYMHPIFSTDGNYPQTVIDRVQAASTAQGLATSRLRPFTQEQIDYIRGSADFLGLNHYTSAYAFRNSSLTGTFVSPSHNEDAFVGSYMDESWPGGISPWHREHGPGLYHLLVHIKDTYNNPTVYVTENGFPTSTGLNDDDRTSYYKNYLNAVLDALAEGCDVRGYFAWSLMDNFEWSHGYILRFGIYEVDMEDPERTRTPRKSALVYKEIISSRAIDFDYNPNPYDTDGAFTNFGDRVKHWLTINEPYIHCNFGYGYGRHAPLIQSPGEGYYECGRHILLANARAYRIYNEDFRNTQNGQVGIVLSSDWAYPASDSADDIQAAEDYLAFHLRLYMDPIFSAQGNYPQTVIDRVQAASTAQGLTASRLRPFTQEQIEYIRGTSDFLALNTYSRTFVVPSHNDDAFLDTYMDDSWPASESPWLREHAPGFYNLLVYIKDTYNNPTVYITENGFSSTPGLHDDGRVNYYRNYLSALLDALAEGCDVRGYFAWSLMDNFEWAMGYTQRFGLYQVDMEDPQRTRTPRKSALVYKEIISSRVIDYDYNPDPYDTDGAFTVSASIIMTLGKGISMWDYLVRTNPNHIADNSNGDIAANSYYNYKRDIEMLKELGATHYRFSISWPRILPLGRPNYVNQRGIDHYNAFIDELIANDIVPFATMYHWDLPQILSELGGWTNEEIVDWFGDYARVLYQNFGDRVKHWLTINEPYIHCNFGYGDGRHAPLIQSPGEGYYECGRHILLANARAYHIYNEDFRNTQNGQVGIVLSSDWAYPASDSDDDIQAAEDYLAFHLRLFMDPIFSAQGNYPQTVIDRVQAASTAQGLNASRLRPFTQEQIEDIRGTSDFLALNSYTSKIAFRNSSVTGTFVVPSHNDDAFLDTYMDDSWPASESPWLREHAPGFYNLLVYIKNTYNNPTVYITENGFSSTPGLNDDGRMNYYRNYLSALLDALAEGCDVRGYFAWSLMDNFEWAMGYTQRFGLYQVDMEDPQRTRTPRKSALVYKEIIRSRVIDYDYNPDPYDTDGAFTVSASIIMTTLALVNAECKHGSKFPSDFLLGASTAAYQIEGGWNADGKGQSMWDWYLHQQPDLVSDHTNGDVAADSYHLYKQDVALLKEMGAKSYRFSLSWTRILPNGTADYINPYGIIYYNNLINELLANDIVPFVTIYHWDLPIGFSNQGGWLTDEIVDKYADYARVVFAAFGDRVKHWITVNEPNIHCTFAYGYGLQPPLVKSPATGYYDCGRNLLLAHAKAYHIYNKEFRVLQRGKIGITVDHDWPMAASDSIDDIDATEDYQAFHLGQYLDPIFRGDYPHRMVDRVAAASLRQGYNSSRLRSFTEEQKDFIKGTTDFVGINHYSSNYVYRNASVVGMYEVPSFDDDAEAYGNPELYITENGFSETLSEDLYDDLKVDYLRTYLDALLDAKAAGSNVQ